MSIKLPVRTDIAEHVICAEVVIRRISHWPIAFALKRRMPPLAVIPITILTEQLNLISNGILIVEEIKSKAS